MTVTINLKKIKKAARKYSAENAEDVIDIINLGEPYDVYFYQNIADPAWIPILVEKSKFSNIPGPISTVNETTYLRFLPLIGLSHVANSIPDLTIKILADLPQKENPQVTIDVLNCISLIDEPRLAPASLEIIKSRLSHHEPRDWLYLDSVFETWVRIGCLDEAIELLEFFLSLHAHLDPRNNAMAAYRLEELDRTVIEPLIHAQPSKMADMFYASLRKWKGLTKDTLPSSYWLSNFRNRSSSFNEFQQILAARLFEIGTNFFGENNQQFMQRFNSLLSQDSWELFKRLRWQLYADFPEQSLAWAKADVLAEIPSMNSYKGSHGYEMAQLLDAHVKKYGSEFLTQSEVNDFFEKVMEGPIEKNEKTDIDDVMIRRFQRRQLQPIAPLLSQEQKVVYEELTKEFPGELALQDYKPFKSGRAYSVKSVTPATTVELAAMNDMAIWKFLNDWLPKNDWRETGGEAIEETVGELGREFSNLFTQNPERFSASSEWWKNIKRPEILSKLLDAATQRITSEKKAARSTEEPKPDQWVAWFGIVDRILELSNDDSPAALDEYKQNVWNWPRRVVVQFMENVIQREQGIPQGYEKRVGEVLQTILLKPDLTESRENPNLDDWLSYAINSVKGSALEALLALAIRQKNSKKVPPETWIYETICKVLCDSDVSPALFAVMGARLRAVLYLYAEQFKQEPEVLMPNDKPEMTEAFIVAHIKYGTWVNQLLEVFPDYPDRALGLLHAKNLETEEDERDRNDYGGRLGLHLCFYFWNDMYGTPESGVRILKRFFRIANPHQRAETIGEISRIFKNEKASDDLTQMLHRLKQIWDLRIQDIEEKQKSEELTDEDILKEVGSFIRWIEIQAMDFTWRHEQIVRALKLCKKAPEHLIYIRDLLNQHTEPNELKGRLEIFKHILQLSNDSNTWYYRDKELIPVLKSALNSEDPQTQQHATEVQEILLRRGCFEFLMDEERHENE
jgi:hypothetical protein